MSQELDSQFIETELEETFTDSEIFYQMFLRPKAVLEFIHKSKLDKYTLILILVYGVLAYSLEYESFSMLFDFDIIYIILILAVGGALLNLVLIWIGAFLLSWTGNWIGGKGSTEDFFRLNGNIIWVELVFLVFTGAITLYIANSYETMSGSLHSGLSYGLGALGLVGGIYSFVLSVLAVMIIQGFSVWRSIGNLLLSALPFIIVAVGAFILGDMIGTSAFFEGLFDSL